MSWGPSTTPVVAPSTWPAWLLHLIELGAAVTCCPPCMRPAVPEGWAAALCRSQPCSRAAMLQPVQAGPCPAGGVSAVLRRLPGGLRADGHAHAGQLPGLRLCGLLPHLRLLLPQAQLAAGGPPAAGSPVRRQAQVCAPKLRCSHCPCAAPGSGELAEAAGSAPKAQGLLWLPGCSHSGPLLLPEASCCVQPRTARAAQRRPRAHLRGLGRGDCARLPGRVVPQVLPTACLCRWVHATSDNRAQRAPSACGGVIVNLLGRQVLLPQPAEHACRCWTVLCLAAARSA